MAETISDLTDIVGKQDQSLEGTYQVLEAVLKLPGIKVNRRAFLSEQFKDCDSAVLVEILEKGPISAGVSRNELNLRASTLIKYRKLFTGTFSFAVAARDEKLLQKIGYTAEFLELFAVAVRLAQELAYLYGMKDLWDDNLWNDRLASKKVVMNQLIVYLGVLFGVSVATPAVRLITNAITYNIKTKLPKKALTETFYYPVVKDVAKALNVDMNKRIFSNGLATIVRLLSAAVQGAITYATFGWKAKALASVLDEACFGYNEDMIEDDCRIIEDLTVEQGQS